MFFLRIALLGLLVLRVDILEGVFVALFDMFFICWPRVVLRFQVISMAEGSFDLSPMILYSGFD